MEELANEQYIPSGYKYWKNGWYFEFNKPNTAIQIPQAEYERLMEGQAQGKQIKSDKNGLPYLVDIEVSEADKLLIKVQALNKWFSWYDNQVSQVQRAIRMNMAWTAADIDKQYYTLAELDAEANIKQEELRVIKLSMVTL